MVSGCRLEDLSLPFFGGKEGLLKLAVVCVVVSGCCLEDLSLPFCRG